jgi:hypothetical protein
MTEPRRAPTLSELAAAEREAAPDDAAEARVWAGVERRLAHGPPPPSLPEPSGLAAAVKWLGGLVLAGGLVTAALVAGGDAGEAPQAPVPAASPASEPVPSDTSHERPPSDSAPPVPSDSSAPNRAAADPAPPVPSDSSAPNRAAADPAPPVPSDTSHERPASDLPDGVDADAPPAAPPVASTRDGAPTAPPVPSASPAAAPSSPDSAKSPRPSRPRAPAPDLAPAAPLDLDAELRLVARIRGALRRGDAAAALAAIAEHRRDFPDGALVQERSAHEVDALCAAGRRDDARELAAGFLARWPDSTHRARVAAACAD